MRSIQTFDNKRLKQPENSLDEKLKEILKWYEISEHGRRGRGDLETTEDKLIAQIKAAFAEENYKQDPLRSLNMSADEKDSILQAVFEVLEGLDSASGISKGDEDA